MTFFRQKFPAAPAPKKSAVAQLGGEIL